MFYKNFTPMVQSDKRLELTSFGSCLLTVILSKSSYKISFHDLTEDIGKYVCSILQNFVTMTVNKVNCQNATAAVSLCGWENVGQDALN